MYANYGLIAAQRFIRHALGAPLEQSASRWNVDACVVAAVLAVEMLARGPWWRALEAATARVLMALGRSNRVERMSLGIAQIQPRHMRGPDRLRDRVGALLQERDSIGECARILAQICRDAGLDGKRPTTWTAHDWNHLALGYGGDLRYGKALASAFGFLASYERL
jgi:hypothetical protein